MSNMAKAPDPFVDWTQLAAVLNLEQVTGNHPSFLAAQAPLPDSFAALLAPLSRDACRPVIRQVEAQLRMVNQTLALLEGRAFEAALQEMLQACALKLGELLRADRTTVFLVDADRQELWSTLATRGPAHAALEIRLGWDQGIVGEVVHTRTAINVPYDFYDDPRSCEAQQIDAKTGYRTYTLLSLPVMDQQGEMLAVVQLLNKCRPAVPSQRSLAERIDPQGFTAADEATFADFENIIRLILESSRAFYLAAQRQQAATVLVKATQALNHSGLDLEDTLRRIMEEAKNLMQADRSTLWVLDRDRHDLWANIPLANGTLQEMRLPVGAGYVGRVAQTGEILNIPYDLYHAPDSITSQRFDERSGYRTYSLLCMPVFDTEGTLIAVSQLVNKYRAGYCPDPANWSDMATTPPWFRASFTDDDEFFMLAFNIHAGVALERALMYARMEEKVIARTQELQRKNEQLQREIQERQRAEQALSDLNHQLAEQARVDALTQVANRRQFDERLDQEWRRMRRERSLLSLILCDIDFFKRYNDHYGHPAGDRCLQQVADAMKQEVKRPGDLLARYGGEEFAILLPKTDRLGAQHLAETVRQRIVALALPHARAEMQPIVTLSLGVATCTPGLAGNQGQLVQAADAALYQAKQQGRDRVVVNDRLTELNGGA